MKNSVHAGQVLETPYKSAAQGRTFYVRQITVADDPCFLDVAGFDYYLMRLSNCLPAYNIQMHAFALLPDAIHLLLTPKSTAGIRILVEMVNRYYREYCDNRHDVRRFEWQSPVQVRPLLGNGLVLDCYKYIELMPVCTGLVKSPGQHHWTSYGMNGFGGHGNLLTMHPAYRELIRVGSPGFGTYRNFVAEPFSSLQEKFLNQIFTLGNKSLIDRGRRFFRLPFDSSHCPTLTKMNSCSAPTP